MIPPRIKAALDNYVRAHQPTGAFCRAVLANNLRSAVLLADPESFAALPEICRYVYCEMPPECHGSALTVAEWLDDRLVRRGAILSKDRKNGYYFIKQAVGQRLDDDFQWMPAYRWSPAFFNSEGYSRPRWYREGSNDEIDPTTIVMVQEIEAASACGVDHRSLT